MSAFAVPNRPVCDPSFDPGPGYSDHRLSLGSFKLAHGHTLRSASLACRLYGHGKPGDKPLFVVLGGISANRQLCDDSAGTTGWWTTIVGPGRALDTHRYHVLGVDFLGAGDSTRPRHLNDWALTPADQARAIVAALQQLNVTAVEGLIGASYGGMVALHWAQQFPATLNRTLTLCAAHRSAPSSSAYRALQRQIVRFAAAHGHTRDGLRLARGLAMLGFRTRRELDQRFTHQGRLRAQQLFLPIEDYLNARGTDYARTQDPASFHCLSQSCDLHHINPANITGELWVAACPEDQVVPYHDVETLVELAPHVRYFQRLESLYGHDCFLKEDQAISHLVSTFVRGGDV